MRILRGSPFSRVCSTIWLSLICSACGGGASNGGASNGGASDGGASDGGASDGGASDGGASAAGASAAGASNGEGAVLQVDHQPSYDFGAVVVGGTSPDVALSITNAGTDGSGPLSAATLVGDGAAQFTVAADGCVGKTLAPLEACSVSVEMAPSEVGTASARFTIGAAPGGSASTELTGTAISLGALVITPAVADFGSQQIGDGKKSLTFTVMNTGDLSTGELSLELGSSNASQYAITGGSCLGSLVLGSGESCTSVVTFHPTKPGTLPATLVANASPGGPGIATLSGVGLSDAHLQFSKGPTPFGLVDANAPKSQTLTVTNTGGVASGNLSIEIAGVGFSVVPGGTCSEGAPLASGASCRVLVQLAPNAIGPITGSISVSATPGGSASAELGGTGQKTVTLTVTAGGTGSGAVSVDGVACAAFPCVTDYKVSDPNRTAVVTQAPGAVSDFSGWKLDCSGTGPCVAKLNQNRTVEVDYVLKQYAVQVTMKNLRGTAGGSVTATSVPAGPPLSCAGDVCSAQYSAGAVVTLTATAIGQTLFQSWGAQCSSRFDPNCSTQALTGSFATTVSFRPVINYMFVSSGTIGPLTLGADLDAADALCDSEARAAWLVDTPSEKPRYFKALISTTKIDARTRIDGAQGFIRPDGREFADLPQNLFAEALATSPFQIFYPPNVTAQGVKISDANAAVISGSNRDGTVQKDSSGLAYTCHDWGSGAITGPGCSRGLPSAGAGDWIDGLAAGDVCNFLMHVYCFETAQPNAPLAVTPPVQKRLAFLSSGSILGSAGRAAADALCGAEAAQHTLPGSYLALMSGANQAPAARFDLSGPPWVRPDGVMIASTATALMTMPYSWLAPLNQRADGSYALFGPPVPMAWFGSGSPTTVSDANDPNCDNWSSTTGSGVTSLAALRLNDNIDSGGNQACSTAHPVFCLQQ